MTYKDTFYGITGASGEGPRLDKKLETGPTIEVMALARNEVTIPESFSYDIHLKYYKRLTEAHEKFTKFMLEKYNYPHAAHENLRKKGDQ